MSSNAWALVQPEVARFTRACSYDRTGYRCSEGGPATDPVGILHALLQNGNVPAPYVIVGHSYGAGLVRRYAYRFQNEVAGMVLAATSYPDAEVLRVSAAAGESEQRLFQIYGWSTRLGLLRLVPEEALPEMLRVYFRLLRKHLPADVSASEIAFLHQSKHVEAVIAEEDRPYALDETEDQAACRRGFGDVPLVVLTEKWVYSSNPSEQEEEEARRDDMRQTQLAALSTKGKKVVVDSGHLIPLERPAAVIDAIRGVVVVARQKLVRGPGGEKHLASEQSGR